MLVDAQADLLILCDYGCTALHYAAMGSHLMQLEILLLMALGAFEFAFER